MACSSSGYELSWPYAMKTSERWKTADVTHTESPNRYREKIPAMRDGGEIAPTLLLEPAEAAYQALLDDFNSNDVGHYRVVSPAGDKAWDFMGYVTNIEHETPMDDTNTVTPTITITGEPTFVDVP